MTLISFVAFAIFFIVLFISLKKSSDFFSPARIFILIWSFSIGLVELKFSLYQHTWSALSWFIILIGISSFLIGIFFPYVINFGRKTLNVAEIRLSLSQTYFNIDKIYYSLIGLFSLYIFAYFVEILIEGYIPLFSANVDRARIDFGVFGLHLLVNNQLVIMFLGVELLILNKVDIRKRNFVILIMFVTFLSFLLLLQRFNLFIWAVSSIGFLYYSSKFISSKKIVLIVLIFSVILWGIQSIRLSQYVSAYIYVISKIKFSAKYALFAEPYMYIVMNFENFARAIDHSTSFSFGILSFDWVFALTGIKNLVQEYFSINPRPFLNSGYNTFPFFWSFYSDFGIIGVFILSSITGYAISEIYYKFKQHGELLYLVFYSFALIIIVMSFFTNVLSMLNFIFNLLILFVIHHGMISKNNIR